MKQSQYEQALAIFKQVREKEEEQFADNHSGRLTCLNNIGICYMKQAKYDAALELFEEVFEKQKHHLGMKVRTSSQSVKISIPLHIIPTVKTLCV